jgi:predicted acyl esterase
VVRFTHVSGILAGALITGSLSVTTLGLDAAHAAEPVDAHGSVHQVYVLKAEPGTSLILKSSDGDSVATTKANALGGALFREVPAGTGYTVASATGEASAPVDVHGDASTPWDTDFYNQKINPQGYQYITTRDGTKLALTVHPPTQPASLGVPGLPVPLPNLPGDLPFTPPYPTLIEYSGYGTAQPDGPVSGIAALANLMGFAVVDVSMRGTGCSGGAFDFFEPLQSLDGYDVIETIARQGWVRGHKVGMMGISYGGISQLFTAATQPPSLSAISPLSVLDAVPTTLYPGGIRNDGFAVAWAQERIKEAQPAGQGLEGTQPYAEKQIADGDATCVANQVLHPDAADLMAKIEANDVYRPEVADPLDPVTFVHKINVPVFMACQWQDEQTGGHCPTLAGRMTGTDKKWFTFTNGVHTDSLDPKTFIRWFDFLMIYVAKSAPLPNLPIIEAAAPVIYQTAFGVPGNDLMTLPVDQIAIKPSLTAAKSAFEQLPRVRVLFNNGAGAPLVPTAQKGDPYPTSEASFTRWPVPGVTATSWYFGANQKLTLSKPSARTTNRFVADPAALPRTDYTGGTATGGLWGNKAQWSWNWKQYPTGTSLNFVSAPLSQTAVTVGAGRVEFWARSSQKDVDLVVTLSEVDAKGNETFVQNGYLRASKRKLSYSSDNIFKAPSTLLEPVLSFLESDIADMPSSSFTKLVVPLYFSGHPYRAGTRIKISIAAPNGTQPIWAFDHTKPEIGATKPNVDVRFDADHPSRIVLPVVTGQTVKSAQPPCGVLRNQPCRPYVAQANTVVQ